jgi:2-methylcitrate dehydratase PrpD
MTLSCALADRAQAPLSPADADRLRTLTLTNLAAGAGALGRATQLLGQLPFDRGRPSDAAFLTGMILHARTQDDFHPTGRVHVGAVTLAATLALADRAGPRMLECLAAGYETMCAVASVYSPVAQKRGSRPTGMFGPIGAAAAAGVALGLDRDGIANAVGLAAARSAGTMQSWLSGTDEWMFEIGAAARAGVEAALFTEAGAVASAEAFEGDAGWLRAYFGEQSPDHLATAVARAGSYVAEVAVKPYPVSGISQVPTALACQAHAELNGQGVQSLVIRLSEREAAYPGSANAGPFRSRSDALMSVAFCVACGLTDGTIRLGRLEQPNELGDVVSAVRVEADDRLQEEEAVLELTAESGQREFRGVGSALLYPEWASLRYDGAVVAMRNEADADGVERFITLLAEERPDASAVRTAFEEAL